MGNFQNVMTEYAANKGSWVDIYPVRELLSARRDGTPMVVDVGGGKGHDLERLRQKCPELPERSLILQDQDLVVETAKVYDPIKTMAYDFFTPQPVKGETLCQCFFTAGF